MTDVNGREIRTGDVVRITDAYFDSDNGLYFVKSSHGDPDWCDFSCNLRRICRNGKISTAKNAERLWPLACFVSNKIERTAAHRWNRERAKIEVIDGIDKTGILEYFTSKAADAEWWIKRAAFDYGTDGAMYAATIKIRDHYLAMVERCGK